MKGQFLLISAIVVGIMMISTANMITESTSGELEVSEIAYTLQEIEEEAEKVDPTDEKEREGFETMVQKIEGYRTDVEYWETNQCFNVTLQSYDERYELHCID